MPEGDARLGSSRGSTEQGDLTGSVQEVQEKMGYSSPTPSDRRGFGDSDAGVSQEAWPKLKMTEAITSRVSFLRRSGEP